MNKLIEGLRPNDARDVVRIVGGLLLALGVVVFAIRRDGGAEGGQSSNFVLFVLWFLAAAIPFGVGVAGRLISGEDRRWQAVLTVAGSLIFPVGLYYLFNSIDSGYDETWATFLIFAALAGVSFLTWSLANVRFQLLLASLFGAIALVALFSKIFDTEVGSPDFDGGRALLLVYAAALVFAAFTLRKRPGPEPEAAFGELLTGAGLAALISVGLGPILYLGFGFAYALYGDGGGGPVQDTIWDVLSLFLGLGLIIVGAGRNQRGLSYIGGFMLVAFAFSVGLDLDDPSPEGKFVGWPLLLILLGGGALAYSVLAARVPPTIGLGEWFQGGREPLPPEPTPEPPTQQLPPEPPTAPTQQQQQPPHPPAEPPPPPPPPQ